MVSTRVDGFFNVFSGSATVRCSSNRKSNFFKSKKSQKDAGSAANLIALLGLFIVLYILFIPPADRELLIGGRDDEADPKDPIEGALVSYLVDTQPGRLFYFYDSEFEHSIPAFTLKESKFSNILVEDNSFVLRRSWFSNNGHSLRFSVPSVRETTGIKLTFNINGQPKGNLIMLLNGNVFFNRELSPGMINPIDIPLDLLSSDNVIEFWLSPADIKFWSPNIYQITDFVIVGDFVDTSDLENSHRFYLKDIEVGNLGESRLIFSPACNRNTVGRLSVFINGQSIYSAIPDCNSLNTVHFLPAILNEENIITFSSAKGDYLISLTKVKTKITDREYPTYYFEIPDSTFDKLKYGRQYIEIEMMLQDDEKFKEAYILVNSVKFFLDTRTNSYVRKLPFETFQKGTNSIQIQPLNSFEVVRLKVGLFDN